MPVAYSLKREAAMGIYHNAIHKRKNRILKKLKIFTRGKGICYNKHGI